VVLDLTGAPALDEAVTARLVAALSAARLLGAEAVVSGLSTQNAQTCARLGVDFAGVRVVVDLAAALDGVPA
jgi:rsbT co-antagonist protein RsbR